MHRTYGNLDLQKLTASEQTMRLNKREPRGAGSDFSTNLIKSFVLANTGLQASDDRDRVFALFPMARIRTTEPLDPFPVDYGDNLSEVYQRATKYLINSLRSFRCLEVFRMHKRLNSIPRWAIDWRYDSGAHWPSSRGRPLQAAPAQDPKDMGRLMVSAITLTVLKIDRAAIKTEMINSVRFQNIPAGQPGIDLDKRVSEQNHFGSSSVRSFNDFLRGKSYKRMLYWDDEPRFGVWVPVETLPGDLLVQFQGGCMPFVVRPSVMPAVTSRGEAAFIGVAAFFLIKDLFWGEYVERVHSTLYTVDDDDRCTTILADYRFGLVDDNNERLEKEIRAQIRSCNAFEPMGDTIHGFQWQEWAIV
ncbi:uncharacterized protein AB675_5423 [Cyphellophora attinorum]|uniref:Heterokaryon incompatibility domain-containing protein n=1 Tax=Cyphellophora attinorum TaxID=1664694 RepID=A0A0N0NNT8_9EURO|nr:uncharacterized protein AB675_5423 [Phialophora attinorum]KPI41971.1 hypothetical protein AB675_5423 [Phialophora attinorum]